MKKILLVLIILFITGCNSNTIVEKNENITEGENTVVNVIIDNEDYIIELEDNEAARTFKEMLPKEFNMKELNDNEKYVYMDYTLPTNSYEPKHIEKGDIMLYGDNCLVIFYKSFNTSYSYTKIGHIENLASLSDNDITVRFEIK